MAHTDIHNICTSWNIAIRRAWDLPRTAHRNLLPGLAGSQPISVILYKKFVSLFKKMYVSQNELVAMIAAYFAVDARSLINKNMQLISTKCKIDIESLLRNKVPSCALNVNIMENANVISVLKELRASREGTYSIPGFSEEEIQYMYDYMSTC